MKNLIIINFLIFIVENLLSQKLRRPFFFSRLVDFKDENPFCKKEFFPISLSKIYRSCLNFEVFQVKEYITAFMRVKGAKVSSALITERLQVALWQNACLNFCTLYPHERLMFILIKKHDNLSIIHIKPHLKRRDRL